MNLQQIQELAENIAIAALNGGELSGFVFRHNDSGQKAKKDAIVITAGPAVPMLYGCRPYRLEMSIEMKSATSTRLAVIHGATLARLQDSAIMRAAALASGLIAGRDNVDVYYEDMSGDRSESQNLRKRTITIPFEVKVGS